MPSWLVAVVQWFGYFLVLLILAMPGGYYAESLYPVPIDSRYIPTRPSETVKELIRDFDRCDMATNAKGALLVARVGRHDNQLLALLWPSFFDNSGPVLDDILAVCSPGFIILEALVLKFVGTNGPFVLGLTIATSAIWALVLLNLYDLVKNKVGGFIAYIIPLAICFSPLLRSYCLRDGVILTESTSTACMCIAFLLLIRSTIEKKRSLALFSGAVLAVAAYFRAQAEMAGMFLSALVFLALASVFLIAELRKRWMAGSQFASALCAPVVTQGIYSMLLAVLVFQSCTIPYKLYNYFRFHTASWLRADSYFKIGWDDVDKALKILHWPADDCGLGLPSQADPQLAAEIRTNLAKYGDDYYSNEFYKQCTMKTIINHPLKWMSLKAPLIVRGWFQPAYVPRDAFARSISDIENFCAAVFLVLCTVMILLPFLQKRYSSVDIIHLFLFLALAGSNFATITVLHIEPRYFYILKLGTYVLLFSIACSKFPDSERSLRGESNAPTYEKTQIV